ncbi:MAG: DUF4390 domain-containing protein [Giesbergeria sp.]
MLLCWASLSVFSSAYAQADPSVAHMEVERSVEGLFLSVSMEYSLPALVEQALQQGIPMTFVAEAEVMRARWYWSDQNVAAAQRYLRLSYQPLTRRWRLNVSSAPFNASGLGVSVGQTYDDLSEVLAVMQRIARWNIADARALAADGQYRVHFSFQLDLSQLPRPLQIGALGRSGWNLSLSRTERVPRLSSP